jgi:hypothetical protein
MDGDVGRETTEKLRTTEGTDKGRSGVFLEVCDAFDLEFRVFEVDEQSDFETGDVEIAEHLGDVAFVERFHHLRSTMTRSLTMRSGTRSPM